MKSPAETENKTAIWGLYAQHRWGLVLECGPLDGRDTVHLARRCEHVVAVEGRLSNLLATDAALTRAGVANVTLVKADLAALPLAMFQRFSCIWCSGVLYHLPRPWEFVQSLTSGTILGWSHVSAGERTTEGGYRGRWYTEGVGSRLSGLEERSFWLLPDEFARMFAASGFRFAWLTEPAPHPNGDLAGQFVATKPGSPLHPAR